MVADGWIHYDSGKCNGRMLFNTSFTVPYIHVAVNSSVHYMLEALLCMDRLGWISCADLSNRSCCMCCKSCRRRSLVAFDKPGVRTCCFFLYVQKMYDQNKTCTHESYLEKQFKRVEERIQRHISQCKHRFDKRWQMMLSKSTPRLASSSWKPF